MDYSRYPSNWKEISLAIRERAGWKCEWCDLPNKAWIVRTGQGRDDWRLATAREVGLYLTKKQLAITKIMLTVAHLGVAKPDGSSGDVTDKMDCRPENLAALCQKCHLNYDLSEHKANAARTRHKKRLAMGQLALEGLEV